MSVAFANRVMLPLVNVAMYFRTVGVVMVGVGAAGAFAFTKMMGPAIEFQDQMAQVATMVDNTSRYMGDFAEGVSDLAMKFGESTETLSKGLYDILSATIAPAKALDVLEVSARAAAAGMTDTGTAADAITTILNAFSLSADRAEDVADLLFAIVRRGKTTFAELAPAIGRVAASAALAGLPLEELGATIATITRAGIPTRVAVTSLNAVLRNFLTPTDQAREAAHELGIELNTTTLRTKGLSGVIVELAGLQPELVGKMFPNVRALRAMAAVLQGATGYAYDYQVMLNRTGMMSEAFEKRTITLRFAIEQLKQTGLALVRMIGTALLPDLMELIKFVTRVATAFFNLDKSTKLLMARMALWVPIWALLLGGVLLLWKTLMGFGLFLAATLIPGMLAFAATPIGAILAIAALTIGVLAGYKAFTQLKGVLDALKGMMDEVKAGLGGLGGGIGGLGVSVEELIGDYKELLEKTDTLGTGTVELEEAKEDLQEAARRLGPEIMSLTSDYLAEKITLDELNESLKLHLKLVMLGTEYAEATRKIEAHTENLEKMEASLKNLEETEVLKPGFWGLLQVQLEIMVKSWWRLTPAALSFRKELGLTEKMTEEVLKRAIGITKDQIELAKVRLEQLTKERLEISKNIKASEKERVAVKALERAQREFRDLVMSSLIDERRAKIEEVERTYERLKKEVKQKEEFLIDGVMVAISLEQWKNLEIEKINRKSLEEQAEFEMKMVGATAERYIEILKERYDVLRQYGSYTKDTRRKIEEKIFDYAKKRQKAMIELEAEYGTELSIVLQKVREIWAGLEGYLTLTWANWTEFMQERERESTKQYEKQVKEKENIADAWLAYRRLIGEASTEDEIKELKLRLATEEMTNLARIAILTRIHKLQQDQIKERKELLDAAFEYEMVTGGKTLADQIERMRERLRNEKMSQTERLKLMTETVEKQDELYEKQQEAIDALFKYQVFIGEKTLEDDIRRLKLRVQAEELTGIELINANMEIAQKEKELMEKRKAFANALFKYLRLINEKTIEEEIARQEAIVNAAKAGTTEKIEAETVLFKLKEKKREQDEEAERAGVESYREIVHSRIQAGIDYLKAAGHGREAEILEIQLALDKELYALDDQLAEKVEKFKGNADLITSMTRAAEDRRYQLRAKAAQDIEAIHRKYTTEEMEQVLERVDLEIKITGEGHKKKIDYLKWWLDELRAGGEEEKQIRSDIGMMLAQFGGDTLRVYDEMAKAGHEVSKKMIGAFAELGDEEVKVLGQLHSAVEDYVNFVVTEVKGLPPVWWEAGKEILVSVRGYLQENFKEYKGAIKKINEALKEGNREYLEYVKATLDFELALMELGKKEQLQFLISFYEARIKVLEAADELDEKMYRESVLEKKKLEDELAEYIKTLSDKIFEYQRLIGEKTLADEIIRLRDRLATEKLTVEERIELLTKIFDLQKKQTEEEKELADKVFAYRRLLGEATLEDEIVRTIELLKNEELTTEERIDLATKLFKFQEDLAKERRETDEAVFEYQRLIGEKTLTDEIVRTRELLENEKLTVKERTELATKLFKLREELAKQRKELDDKVFEYQRLIGDKTLEDEIARLKELLTNEKLTLTERLDLATKLFDTQKEFADKQKELADLTFEYQRLIGEKTIEDEIKRLSILLLNEKLTAEERIELDTNLFNLRKELADEQRELADQTFEYLRLTGDKTLEDEIARTRTHLRRAKLYTKERVELATKLFNLEKELEEEREKLATARFEFARKLELKTLDDAIARQKKLAALEEAGTTERLEAQLTLYSLISEREKELVEELRRRGATTAEIRAKVEALWRASCRELGLTAEETTRFIAERWRDLIENTLRNLWWSLRADAKAAWADVSKAILDPTSETLKLIQQVHVDLTEFQIGENLKRLEDWKFYLEQTYDFQELTVEQIVAILGHQTEENRRQLEERFKDWQSFTDSIKSSMQDAMASVIGEGTKVEDAWDTLVRKIREGFVEAFAEMILKKMDFDKFLLKNIDLSKASLEEIKKWSVETAKALKIYLETLKKTFFDVGDVATDAFGRPLKVIDDLINKIEGATKAAQGLTGELGWEGMVEIRPGVFAFPEHQQFVGAFPTGGVVPETGFAKVEKGERIIPAGESVPSVAFHFQFMPGTKISDIEKWEARELVVKKIRPILQELEDRRIVSS